MKTTKIFKPWHVMLCLALGLHITGSFAQAQTQTPASSQPPHHTYAPGSPTYYRNTHGEKERVEVYRRDPNIWVYTPEVAKRAGMPLEWASDELKGVAAAAFRLERDGAEEDCGWGGNRNACKPVYQCVLELYFDRQEHKLPWDKDALVVDVYRFTNGSYGHLPIGPTFADEPRTRRGLLRQPFTDPETGEELSFGAQAIAYDREIHGRYAFVRLELGCHGIVGHKPTDPIVFQLKKNYRLQDDDWRKDQQSKRIFKIFHDVYLPASWNARVAQLRQQNTQRDQNFYQEIWKNINQGIQK